MCGIYGLVSLSERPLETPPLDRVRHSLRHRGPDGSGCRQLRHAVLGAERLRIVDPRSNADQPFATPDASVWLVGNGEIYNAPELRNAFPDYPYRSASDVESVLPLVSNAGADAWGRLEGMFALAVWDERRGRLTLARDRAGEKPLFYARREDRVAFASEIEAVLLLLDLPHEPDHDAVRDFLALGYVREPRTMFLAVRQLEPGTTLTLDAGGERRHRFWRPEEIGVTAQRPAEAADRLDALLNAAVRRQLRADRPRGVFSSGGVDSGLLTALAVRHAGADAIESFCVGFEDRSYDERVHAERLARRLGVRHTTVLVGDQALVEAFETLTRTVSEPLGDPAALPTWLLAREASAHVKVVLSGEGADELFGGYPTYLAHRMAPWWLTVPRPARAALHGLIDRYPASRKKVTVEYLLKRFARGVEDEDWRQRHLKWFATGLVPPSRDMTSAPVTDAARAAMLLDYQTYLQSGLLPKIDRATMRHGLESRAPYLDREVAAFALSLPSDLRVRRLTTKWLLKRVAARYVPRRVVRRRKRGLSVPLARWINGALRPEVDRLLAFERLARWPIVDVEAIGRLLAEHRGGRANHARTLWPLIVLERWAEHWTE